MAIKAFDTGMVRKSPWLHTWQYTFCLQNRDWQKWQNLRNVVTLLITRLAAYGSFTLTAHKLSYLFFHVLFCLFVLLACMKLKVLSQEMWMCLLWSRGSSFILSIASFFKFYSFTVWKISGQMLFDCRQMGSWFKYWYCVFGSVSLGKTLNCFLHSAQVVNG